MAFRDSKNEGVERCYGTAQLLVLTALGLAAYFSGLYWPLLGSVLYTLFAIDAAILAVFAVTAIVFSVFGAWLASGSKSDGDTADQLRDDSAKYGLRSAFHLVYVILVFAVVSINYWRS